MISYIALISLATIISLFWFNSEVKKHALDELIGLQVFLIILVSAFVGARLFHVIYEEFDFYREHPLMIFQFWYGGFVFYGGLLLALISGITFLKIIKISSSKVETFMDISAPIISFAYALGRVGCFIVGCCYGRHSELPWNIDHRHPTQLYAIIWDLLLMLSILFINKRFQPGPGAVFYLWLCLHSIGRIIMEYFRDDPRGEIYLLSISTWISLGLFLIGIYQLWHKKRKGAV